MNFQLSTNGYNIINSGSVFLYDANSDLKFSIKASADFSFEIILRFQTNENEEQSLKKEIIGNSISFICINFSNTLGTGTVRPLSIATIDNKELFLHFWSYLQGKNSTRKVEYTFLEKE